MGMSWGQKRSAKISNDSCVLSMRRRQRRRTVMHVSLFVPCRSDCWVRGVKNDMVRTGTSTDVSFPEFMQNVVDSWSFREEANGMCHAITEKPIQTLKQIQTLKSVGASFCQAYFGNP